jgi:hypothetical protein
MIDFYNKTKMMTMTNEVKWNIVDYVGKKYGFKDGWSVDSIDVKDQDKVLIDCLSAIDEAIEYYSEYSKGNFEIDRFFGKFDKFMKNTEIKDMESVKKLISFKEYILEVYKSGHNLS